MPDLTGPGGQILKDDPSYPAYDTQQPENGQAGLRVPSWGFGQCGIGAVSNATHWVRFVPSRKMKITKIRIRVMVAAGSNDAIDVGIFSGAGLKLQSTGSIPGVINSTGLKDIAITPVTVEAGKVYYVGMAVAVPGTTAAQFTTIGPGSGECWSDFGTTPPQVDGMTQIGTGTPLPNDMSGATFPVLNGLLRFLVLE